MWLEAIMFRSKAGPSAWRGLQKMEEREKGSTLHVPRDFAHKDFPPELRRLLLEEVWEDTNPSVPFPEALKEATEVLYLAPATTKVIVICTWNDITDKEYDRVTLMGRLTHMASIAKCFQGFWFLHAPDHKL